MTDVGGITKSSHDLAPVVDASGRSRDRTRWLDARGGDALQQEPMEAKVRIDPEPDDLASIVDGGQYGL